jgi:hypothetical protein
LKFPDTLAFSGYNILIKQVKTPFLFRGQKKQTRLS